LKVGDQLMEGSCTFATVVATRYEAHPEGIEVFNIRVAEAHTYLVRANGFDGEPIWVHNAYDPEEISAAVRRNTPGIATASGPLTPASSDWLNAGIPAPIPSQVANDLVGREFSTFDDLREAIWLSIASKEELNGTFSASNLGNIEAGNAPFAPTEFQADQSQSGLRFNLHHVEPIEAGGDVYDLSNLQIVSPRIHDDIHYGV
jgi:hypothetical protein